MAKMLLEGSTLRVEGPLDIRTVKDAHAAVMKASKKPNHFDANGLELLDTAGVQWLYWLASHHGGAISVTNATAAVKSTLKMAGFEGWVS